MSKAIIFDSGPLINLSINGLLYIIEELKKTAGIRFFITEDVKYEIVDRPVTIHRFELGALNIKNLIDNKVIEMPEDVPIPGKRIKELTSQLMNIANQTVNSQGKFVSIVSNAEISCLALSQELTEIKIENLIAIDERTTRILSEKPLNLEHIMASRLHQLVRLEQKNFKFFQGFRFIRSTELVYVAFKKGILKVKDPRVLEAALYATKFHGSSVSFEEIEALKKL